MSLLSESNIFLSKIFNQKDGLSRTSSNMTLMKMARSKQDHRVEDKAQSLRQLTALQSQRTNHLQFFAEYRIMDNNFTIIKAALDIYAEETMNRGLNGNVIKIESSNSNIVKELETLFFKVLKINKNGYLWWRDTCKFGNTYAYIESNKIDGVTGLVLLPPDSVFKNTFYSNLYGDDGDNFVWQNMVLEPWEIVHWKNTESIDNEPYGQSILRCLIETWRRVVLMREALIIYRITRAPSRYLFKVDTTGLDSDAADRFVQEVRKAATKKPMIDPKTGNMNFDYNALSIEDNVYVPTEEGSQTDVSILEGASNLNDVEDYKIIKDDIFAGLKIPKSHLGFEEDLAGKSNLADEDNRFSRVILRHQNEFIEGIVHIAAVHLFLKGYTEEEIENFSIQMFNPNSIAENKKLELTKTRVDLFDSVWKPDSENFQIMSYRDACKTVMQMSDEEIDRSIKQQLLEKKLAKKYGFVAQDSAEESGDSNDMGDGGDGGEEGTNEFGGEDTPTPTKTKGPTPKLGKLNFESKNSLKSKILQESHYLR